MRTRAFGRHTCIYARYTCLVGKDLAGFGNQAASRFVSDPTHSLPIEPAKYRQFPSKAHPAPQTNKSDCLDPKETKPDPPTPQPPNPPTPQPPNPPTPQPPNPPNRPPPQKKKNRISPPQSPQPTSAAAPRDVAPNVVSQSSALSSAERGQRWPLALELLGLRDAAGGAEGEALRNDVSAPDGKGREGALKEPRKQEEPRMGWLGEVSFHFVFFFGVGGWVLFFWKVPRKLKTRLFWEEGSGIGPLSSWRCLDRTVAIWLKQVEFSELDPQDVELLVESAETKALATFKLQGMEQPRKANDTMRCRPFVVVVKGHQQES